MSVSISAINNTCTRVARELVARKLWRSRGGQLYRISTSSVAFKLPNSGTCRLFAPLQHLGCCRGRLLYYNKHPFSTTMATQIELPATQSAIILHNPGPDNTLTFTSNLPLPTPAPDEVLIRNTYAGVNYIDNYFRSGLYPLSTPILGNEGEGHIVSLGANISTHPDPTISALKIGDRVAYFASQSYAQYTVAPAKAVTKLPTWLPEGHGAAALIQGLTALSLITESYKVKRGDWVLVHAAAGGVGLWLLQLLKLAGAHTIATASTHDKLQLAIKNGAEFVVNYTTYPADWPSELQKIPGFVENGGVEVVYDSVGKATFEGSLQVLKRKGTMVSFGNASGAVDPVPLTKLTGKNLKLLRPRLHAYVETREEFVAYSERLWEILRNSEARVYVYKVYPWAEIETAHRDIRGRGTIGKLLLKVD